MSCLGCKGKIKTNEERKKIRELAKKIAEAERKSQVIIDVEGKLYIDCAACWEKAGRIGTPIEYFIV
jgi:hypothetical protein